MRLLTKSFGTGMEDDILMADLARGVDWMSDAGVRMRDEERIRAGLSNIDLDLCIRTREKERGVGRVTTQKQISRGCLTGWVEKEP